jgi:hypothetical protein
MNFTQWFENRRETASKFRDLLGNVPQEPDHHPEGDVLTHTKMVRASINKAIDALKVMKPNMPILDNISFDGISPVGHEILAMAAWVHDIGKHTATETQPSGKVTAYGHQDPNHFLPQINKFKDIATPATKQLYTQYKELIDFLVTHHMSFMSKSGFPKSFRAEWTDEEGKLKDDPKVKFLIILMMADKMGRGIKPGETQQDVSQKAIGFNQSGLQTTYDKALKRIKNVAAHKAEPFQGDVQSFVDMLKSRGLDDNVIKRNVKNKFGIDID